MESPDPRRQRSRAALLAAFFDQVLRLSYDQISIAGLIAQAGVARSTFYEHFDSKDSLLAESLQFPLAPLADLASEQPSLSRAEAALAHLWQNRQLAAGLLQGAVGRRVLRVLQQMIGERLSGRGPYRLPLELVAVQLAGAMYASLDAWLRGGGPTARDLAVAMAASTATARVALQVAA